MEVDGADHNTALESLPTADASSKAAPATGEATGALADELPASSALPSAAILPQQPITTAEFVLTGTVAWSFTPSTFTGTWIERSKGKANPFSYRLQDRDDGLADELALPAGTSSALEMTAKLVAQPASGIAAAEPSSSSTVPFAASCWRGQFGIMPLHSTKMRWFPDAFIVCPHPDADGAAAEVPVVGKGANAMGQYRLRGTYTQETHALSITRVYTVGTVVKSKPHSKPRPKSVNSSSSSSAGAGAADIAGARRLSSRKPATRELESFVTSDDLEAAGVDEEHTLLHSGHGSGGALVSGAKRKHGHAAPGAEGPLEEHGGSMPFDPDAWEGVAAAAALGTVDAGWVGPLLLGPAAGALAGCLFEGEAVRGVPHGFGTAVYPNGCMYEGAFLRGRETGRGVFSDEDDIVLYQGDLVDGTPSGIGTFYYGNGDRYAGQWRDGLFSGRGLYTSATGGRYDGDWLEGLRHGSGTMITADGSMYQGMWVHGQRNGRGDFAMLDGYKFRGLWVNDIPQGKGEVTYADGARYDGSFKDGKRDGKGTYWFPSGQQYTGRFVADGVERGGAGSLTMSQSVALRVGEWMIPVSLGGDPAAIHVRAGFERSGH